MKSKRPFESIPSTEPVQSDAVFPADSDDSGIQVGELITLLLEHKWLIVAITAVALLIGGIRGYLAPPVFRADALLQIDEAPSGGVAAIADLAPLVKQSSPVGAELEILRSRLILGKVVEKLKLDIVAKPRYFRMVGQAIARHYRGGGVAEPWFGQSRYGWGGEVIAVERLDVPSGLLGKALSLEAGVDGAFTLRGPEDAWEAQGRVGERLDHGLPDGTELSLFVSRLRARPGTLFSLTRIPRASAVRAINAVLSTKEKGYGTGIFEVVATGPIGAELSALLDEILGIYVRYNLEQRSAEAENTLRFLKTQLPALKEQLDASEGAYNSYRLEQGSVDLSSETQTILQLLVDADAHLEQLQQERVELRQRFKPVHPNIKAVDAQLVRWRKERERLEGLIAKLPVKQQKILRLRRDMDVNTKLYMELLSTAQGLEIAKAGTVGTARVIDVAEVSGQIAPNRRKILMVSAILGLLVSIGLISLNRLLRNTVDDPEEIERALNLPVFATVPLSKVEEKNSRLLLRGKRGSNILASDAPEDDAIESLRGLRATLHFVLSDAPTGGILIAGPSANVGKSFISINLAAVIAQAGFRVVVVDTDLRRGHLHRGFGVERGHGVADYLVGDVGLDAVVQSTAIPNCDLITTGTRPPNPTELLMNERFGTLVKHLLDTYDRVLFDAPPVLAVSDAAIIGRHLGSTLLITRAGIHPMRELEQTVRKLSMAGVNVRGIILNALDTVRMRYRYGYKGYHYQYTYKKA